MRSSLVWLERLTANAEVATVLGSIPTSSDKVESEGRQMKQCWIQYIAWVYLKGQERLEIYVNPDKREVKVRDFVTPSEARDLCKLGWEISTSEKFIEASVRWMVERGSVEGHAGKGMHFARGKGDIWDDLSPSNQPISEQEIPTP